MATDVFPCEDGHAQERSLLHLVQESVEQNDVLVMDRNFSVRGFLLGIIQKNAFFVCREHQGLAWEAVKEEKYAGKTSKGKVYEQWISILDENEEPVRVRRIRIVLDKETRDGEKEICIITNLPKSVANWKKICELYEKRWGIETMFQELEAHLHSEVNELGYPKAALFGFCVALVGYNILAVVKAALRAEHGETKVENELSAYYLALNISNKYAGMIDVLEKKEWEVFHHMSDDEFIQIMRELASNVNMKKLKKAPSRKRKPKDEPIIDPYKGHNHVSTAKLLKGIMPK